MTALEVYKPPFTIRGSKIFTSEGRMALDFLRKFTDITRRRVVDILNGESTDYLTSNISYNAIEILVDKTPIMCIRGWGRLTGIGGLHLHHNEAARIQDEFGEWIVKRLKGDE